MSNGFRNSMTKQNTTMAPDRQRGKQAQTELPHSTAEEASSQLNPFMESVLGGWMLFQAVRDKGGKIVDFVWLSANMKSQCITGRAPSDLLGKRLLQEMPGNKTEGLFDAYVVVTETGQPFEHEFYYQHELVDHWIKIRAVKSNDGFAVSFQDITEEKQRDKLFNIVFDASYSAMVLVNEEGTIELLNHRVESLFGYTQSELLGKNIDILVPYEQRAEHVHHRKEYLKRATTREMAGSRDLYGEHKDGHLLPVEVNLNPIRFKEERLFLATVRDISERKQTERQLSRMSHFDPLTGLPNRLQLHRKVQEFIQHADEEGSSFAMLFVDLDNFKIVNDSLGHVYGDQLIIEASTRLSEQYDQELLCSRISSDEFVLVLKTPPTQTFKLSILLHDILRRFREPFKLGHKVVRLSATVGVSQYPKDGGSATELLQAADAAMFLAKSRGGNRFQYYLSTITQDAQKRLDLESGLRQALDNQTFELVYQPQIHLPSRQYVGVEALLRWKHPEKGYISPAQFIPIAEQRGMADELGTWVLRHTCQQGKRWLDAGFEFGKIAVNVAAQQMKDGTFPQTVQRVLEETGLPSSCLELEITESFAMQRAESSIAQLKELCALGVKIAVDDFGTGYSSLSYLTQLPIHKLKIDKSFVQGVTEDPKATAVVTAIIAMANALGLELIAEGIETSKQAELLLQRGCLEGQGFHFSRPLRVDKLESFVREGKLTYASRPDLPQQMSLLQS
ncbi:MAG: EAL domain-containing protein [Deltaproteobacteria bacterium]|nr:MAG: EAL domain-containing protein [Deltaproteobacteria bacterium]